MTTNASFGAHTTGKEVVDAFPEQVKGKIFVVTGPTPTGIGATTLTALATAGPAALVLIGRTPAKFQSVVEQINGIDSRIKTVVVQADLASLKSVCAAASSILADDAVPHIDTLINNAGVMACPYALTEDGFETQFATNHLAHFLLTALLWPKLKASGAPTVVNVTSSGHRLGHGDYSDHTFLKTEYKPFTGYGQSKLANVLFSRSLAQRGVRAFAVHPGAVATALAGYVTPEMRVEIDKIISSTPGWENRVRKNIEEGCSTQLVAALDPKLVPGSYLSDCQLGETTDIAKDLNKANELWQLSEELVGEKFTV